MVMSRGRSNEHLVSEDRGEDFKANGHDWRYSTLCGDQTSWRTFIAKDVDGRATCRKCHAAYFAAKLEADPNGFRLGARLSLEEMGALGRKWDYRHAYPVIDVADREWGFIVLPGGFGAKWRFVVWSSGTTLSDAQASREGTPAMGYEISENGSNQYAAREFSSKEAILWELPQWITVDRVRCKDAEILRSRVWAERVRDGATRAERLREEQRAAEAQRELDLDHIAVAFVEMLLEGSVSNHQREAIFLAMKHLGISGLESL
jgi:hypothetical protein